jgi:hypothetical protein
MFIMAKRLSGESSEGIGTEREAAITLEGNRVLQLHPSTREAN